MELSNEWICQAITKICVEYFYLNDVAMRLRCYNRIIFVSRRNNEQAESFVYEYACFEKPTGIYCSCTVFDNINMGQQWVNA